MESKGSTYLSGAFVIFSLLAVALGSSMRANAEPVDPDLLHREIAAKRMKISEFKKIAEYAKKRGLRVYLGGGAASSYGDFVKHQILGMQGKLNPPPGRLDDKLTNAFFPEQDLDLVVTRANGTVETVQELKSFQNWLEKKIPRVTIHGKNRWEVLGLKTSNGKHIFLEGNPEFLNQNNDSLSTGLIELTEPAPDSTVVRDIQKGGRAQKSQFLQDLADDNLTFFRNEKHKFTSFAVQGRNPEILSAIRSLIKALRYNRDIDAASFEQIRAIVREFDPRQVLPDSYVSNWIEGRGPALITQAYDPYRARQILDELGLTEKLLRLRPLDAYTPHSFTWWLNKEPVPIASSEGFVPNKKGSGGLTAKNLGVTHVAHKTGADAHRLVTWRYDGIPRAFFSRQNTPGETAQHGKGFYTELGDSVKFYNTKESGYTAVFEVDPNAELGRDFLMPQHNLFLWHDTSKLRIASSPPKYPVRPPTCGELILRTLAQNIQPKSLYFRFARQPTFIQMAVLGGGGIGIINVFEKLKGVDEVYDIPVNNSQEEDGTAEERKRLANNEANERIRGLTLAGQIDRPDTTALLLYGLGDRIEDVRNRASHHLIGRTLSTAEIPVIEAVLKRSSEAGQPLLIDALSSIDSEEIVPVLEKLLQSNSWKTRKAAVAAFAKKSSSLEPIIHRLTDLEPPVRVAAVEALKGKQFYEAHVPALSQAYPQAQVAEKVEIANIAKDIPGTKSRELLMRMLKDNDPSVLLAALTALKGSHWSPEEVPQLRTTFQNAGPQARTIIGEITGKIPGKAATALLCTMLYDGNSAVRDVAINAITKNHRKIGEEDLLEIERAIDNFSDAILLQIIEVIDKIDSPKTVQILRNLTERKNWPVRKAATTSLAKQSSGAAPVIARLTDGSNAVKDAALEGLRSRALTQADVPALLSTYNLSYEKERAGIAELAGRIPGKESTELLCLMLKDQQESVRKVALELLNARTLGPVDMRCLGDAFTHTWKVTRAGIARLAEKIPGNEALELLVRMLKDQDSAVRAAAIASLKIKLLEFSDAMLPKIEIALNESYEDGILMLIDVLESMATPKALEVLERETLKNNVNTRKAAVIALGRKSSRLTSVINRLSDVEQVRKAALSSLSGKKLSRTDVPALAGTLENARPELRTEIAKLAGEIDGNEATELLIKMLKDLQKEVTDAVLEALLSRSLKAEDLAKLKTQYTNANSNGKIAIAQLAGSIHSVDASKFLLSMQTAPDQAVRAEAERVLTSIQHTDSELNQLANDLNSSDLNVRRVTAKVMSRSGDISVCKKLKGRLATEDNRGVKTEIEGSIAAISARNPACLEGL